MDIRYPFDRVVVMDPLALTGEALCVLATEAGIAGRPSVYVRNRSELERMLAVHTREYLLVITEVRGHQGSLADGFALLDELRTRQQRGQLRVMVCTDMDDALMLKMIRGREPSVLSLRRESLPALLRAMWSAGKGGQSVRCSQAVTRRLLEDGDICPAPREMAWLLTQVDGMSLYESARAMSVCDKTAWTWRATLTRRLGGKRAFLRYVVRLQRCLVPCMPPEETEIRKRM